jgi:hypothetical protein
LKKVNKGKHKKSLITLFVSWEERFRGHLGFKNENFLICFVHNFDNFQLSVQKIDFEVLIFCTKELLCSNLSSIETQNYVFPKISEQGNYFSFEIASTTKMHLPTKL